MTKIEYWDMGESIFAKVTKDGIVASSKKIPKTECPKSILDKFNGKNYFFIENATSDSPFEEIEEPKVSVSSPAISSEELASVLSTSVDKPIVTETKVDTTSNVETAKKEEVLIRENSDKPSKKPVKKDAKKSIKEEKYDFVQHPKHYNGHKIITKTGTFEYETIQYLESLVRRLEPDLYSDESGSVYCAAKYMDRIGGGKPDGKKTVREKIAEDCRKIGWYMNHCAELIEANGFEPKHNNGDK